MLLYEWLVASVNAVSFSLMSAAVSAFAVVSTVICCVVGVGSGSVAMLVWAQPPRKGANDTITIPAHASMVDFFMVSYPFCLKRCE